MGRHHDMKSIARIAHKSNGPEKVFKSVTEREALGRPGESAVQAPASSPWRAVSSTARLQTQDQKEDEHRNSHTEKPNRI